MAAQFGQWIGLGGVAANDNRKAHEWEKRLNGVMIGIALLSIPVAFLDVHTYIPWLREFGSGLHWFILAAFTAELLWMLHVSSFRFTYLLRNWLNVVIIVFTLFSLGGWAAGVWVASARLARLALVGLLVARAFSSLGSSLVSRSVPLFIGLSVLMLLVAGSGFYLLEPTVHSFGDGLWLAFVTGSTVGYGDLVPTTTASRAFAVIMVLVGFALLSVVTASISAFLIGEDEKRLRREMHHDIRQLREEVRRLREEIEQLKSSERHHR